MTKKYNYLFHNIIAAPFDGFYEMRRRNKVIRIICIN